MLSKVIYIKVLYWKEKKDQAGRPMRYIGHELLQRSKNNVLEVYLTDHIILYIVLYLILLVDKMQQL